MLQLRKAIRVLAILALSTAALAGAACGDDSSTGNQLSNFNLVGDWTMVSFQVVPQQAITPPAGTGTLHLTDTDYRVLILLNTGEEVDTVANDSGTYLVSGSSWSQTSFDPGQPQATGNAALTTNGNVQTLVVHATAAGVATHSIWTRQP